MSVQTRGWFVGEGPLLARCAELYLTAGHTILGIATSDAAAVRRLAGGSLPIVALPDAPPLITATPFDYLFSIGNHTMLGEALITAPRRAALNFHYGPLPAYAGVHAPVWALLNGESRHGVTWHEMTSGVDAGRIVKQAFFDLPHGETAAGLNALCFDAGIETFSALVADITADAVTAVPQDASARTVFRRHDRPAHHGILDWSTSPAAIARVVHAFDFGRSDNDFAAARLLTRNGALLVTDVATATTPSTGAIPGTVVGITAAAIEVATATATVAVRGLRRLTGSVVSIPDAVREFGLAIGTVLPSLSAGELRASAGAFDSATRGEAEWLTRLRDIAPLALSEGDNSLSARADAARTRVVIDVPATLLDQLGESPGVDRGSVLLALAAVYITRASGGAAATLPLTTDRLADAGGAGWHPLLSAHVPVRIDLAKTWPTPLQAIEDVRSAAETRGSFFVDVSARYPSAPALAQFDQWRHGLVLCLTSTPERPQSAALALVASPHSSQLIWDGSSAAYSQSAIERMAREFRACVDDLAAHPGKSLASLSRLSPDERHQVLTAWNDTAQATPATLIHRLFEEQVRRTPDATAIVFRDRAVTYRDLNRHANRLAATLRDDGIGPDQVVGVFVNRSIEMVVALLGILKAGGAYLPLDPAFPQERLAWMLEDTAAPIVVTQPHLVATLPRHQAKVVTLDAGAAPDEGAGDVDGGATATNLAYVIFTSGSTGRPKGVMVEHRQVVNFFAGMDGHLDARARGTWLAVTSISFDISVLELFWTLARGFTVVLQEELVKAAGASTAAAPDGRGMNFGLFYFSANAQGDGGNHYRLLLEGAKYADGHGFTAVWTPERHFHQFGGLYPNPAVTSAAVAAVTSRIRVRAGSVVLPLHNPIRVAEEWAVVDQLSGGRVELSFASGWHASDFALMPQNYKDRREIMLTGIETIRRLWRGESVSASDGHGAPIEVKVFPAPVQERPPFWIAAAGSPDTFRLAGKLGANLLTNLLGQKADDVASKIAMYRAAWQDAKHEGTGVVALMLHTFVGPNLEEVRNTVRQPLIEYLKSSTELVKQARWEFPAFANPGGQPVAASDVELTPDEIDAMMSHAFERYFQSSGLFGTPEMCVARVQELKALGVDEIACLIDFGIATDTVLDHLPYLNDVRERSVPRPAPADHTIAAQIARHGVTHLQATPSLIRTILADDEGRSALARVSTLIVGGEPLPPALAGDLLSLSNGELLNMYGPTETTVWSSVARITDANDVTIGRPIANTQIYIVDPGGEPQPIGVPGELLIGGDGVTRGYWQRPELTAERYVPNRYGPEGAGLLYRTGDVARYGPDGRIECLGRVDQQVKISGHRIELGEIEAVLDAHPSVAHSAVAVRPDAAGESRLVGYVVPRAAASTARTGDVQRWQTVWDQTYAGLDATSAAAADSTFDLSGWRDSYSGEAIAGRDMEEWVAATVARVQALAPRRILEIGSGTGLLLHRLAPHVEHYTAIDYSPVAVARVQAAVDARGLTNVTVRALPADALTALGDVAPVDVVVINSVAQYFPDAEYLLRVLQQAVSRVAPGGAVFLGDVRNLALLEAFHTSIELAHAPAGMTTADLRQRIQDRVRHDPELVIAPDALRALAAEIPGVTGVDIQLRRGHAHNEMTRFRYDAVLRVGGGATGVRPTEVKGRDLSVDGIQAALASAQGAVTVRGIRNPRISYDVAAGHVLASRDCPETVAELRHRLGAGTGLEPDDLVAAAPGWEVDFHYASSGALDEYDATFRSPGVATLSSAPDTAPARPWREGVHQSHGDQGHFIQELKHHLRARVPAFMVPGAFVMLEAMPLTPNGKVDRNALPDPDRQRQETAAFFVAPGNAFERLIAETWQELLALDRVGAHDNFFDLGANSLLMVKAHAQLRDKLGRPLSLVDLFRFPSVSALAVHLGHSGDETPSAALTASETRAQARLGALGRRRQTGRAPSGSQGGAS